ncbi:replication initiator protein A (plasmid) [Ligilactobacillus acidipiscis]|uniref:replication initiator protein A n=1 Tax=Ligilactobacillus acidipiscis TaxID=89059 RepID=UPI00386F8C5B
MSEDKYYYSEQVYSETFYQLPKVLFTNQRYKNISNDAKVAFALLKDRFNYSIRNHWIDKEKRIYFIFTNQELMSLLNNQEKKVIKIKKELEQVGLLEQKRMGLNQPNRLYLLRPEVEATDIYLQANAETLDNSGTVKKTVPETLDNSGTVKKTVPVIATKSNAETLDNSGTVKKTGNLYNINSLDTNRYNIDTAELDFSTENYSKAEIQKQNQDLIEQAYKFLTNDEAGIPFEPETVKLISLWTNNPKQVRKFIGIILNARKAVQEEHNISFILDDEPELQAKITQTIRRYFNALRSDDKKIRNQENYLYITMKNMFENYGSARQQQEYRAEHPTKKDREEAFINGLKGGLPESIRNAENYK